MNYRFTLLLLIFCFLKGYSQSDDCIAGNEIAPFRPNYLTMEMSNRGSVFNGFNYENPGFDSPLNLDTFLLRYLLSDLWLGAKDENGNLRIAASFFSDEYNIDFYPGLLDSNGETYDSNCKNWDKIWTVSRYDIQSHIQDYEEDGVIGLYRKSIFSWPAKGNAHFLEYNGFELPEGRDLAPFHDENGNGFYEPHQGDYPLPGQCTPAAIPEITAWWAFNDKGGPHTLSEGTPISFDFQMTLFGFYCPDDIAVNRTLFSSLKICNRDSMLKNKVHLGHLFYVDYNFLPGEGSYYACEPNLNTYYQYSFSKGSIPYDYDSLASGGVLSTTFLSHEMSGFQMFANGGFGNPHSATTGPHNPQGYYNYLTGKWKDGRPLTYGGFGYDSFSTDTVRFLFPERPFNPNSWSLVNEPQIYFQAKGIGSINLGDMPPQSELVVDMMLSFHFDNGNLAPDNIDILYEKIPELQELYNQSFTNFCEQPEICYSECVWPGDATQDGIVTYHDLLDIKVFDNKSGKKREGPLYWSAFNAEDWGIESPEGIDLKHMDFNGDGIISDLDEEIFELHFGIVNDFYSGPIQNPISDNFELSIHTLGGNIIDTIFHTNDVLFLTINFNPGQIDSLYGLAYSITFDTSLIGKLNILQRNGVFEDDGKLIDYKWPGRIDFVEYNKAHENHITAPNPMLGLKLKDIKLPVTNYKSTEISIDNIRAVLIDGTDMPLGSASTTVVLGDKTVNNSEIHRTEFSIHPNPVNSFLTVLSEYPIEKIEIFNLSGEMMTQKNPGLSNKGNYEFHLSGLNPGIYLINIVSENGYEYSDKIVVLR